MIFSHVSVVYEFMMKSSYWNGFRPSGPLSILFLKCFLALKQGILDENPPSPRPCSLWVNSVLALLYVWPEVFHNVSWMYDRCSSGIWLVYDRCSCGMCLVYEPFRTLSGVFANGMEFTHCVVVYGGSVGCGIVTSHKHQLWQQFDRLSTESL